MKIIHITSETGWRGGEKQLFYLIEFLQRAGIENILVCPKHAEIRERLKNSLDLEIPVHTIDSNNPYNLSNWMRLRSLCQSIPNPLIHIHTPSAHTLAFLANLPDAIPQVLHRRTMFQIKRNWLTRKKYNSEKIKKIVCVSEAIRRYVVNELGNEKRVVTIHDGIDTNKIIPDYEIAHNRLCNSVGIGNDCKIIGNISALTTEKGYDTFIQVAKLMVSYDSKVHFIIAGSGNLEEKIASSISRQSLTSHVHLIGFQKNVHKILPGFDVFFMPSVVEGLGTSIMDAFLSNVPVISTITGGIPELVLSKKTGLLYEIGDVDGMVDGINLLLSDESKRSLYTKNAANHMLHFSKEIMGKKTLDLYKSI